VDEAATPLGLSRGIIDMFVSSLLPVFRFSGLPSLVVREKRERGGKKKKEVQFRSWMICGT